MAEESTEVNEEEQLTTSGEEGDSEEKAEEYLFEDEEPLPAGILDVKALEIMVTISELLNEALVKNLDPKEVAEKIRKLQARLSRVRRKKRKQSRQARRKTTSKVKGGRK